MSAHQQDAGADDARSFDNIDDAAAALQAELGDEDVQEIPEKGQQDQSQDEPDEGDDDAAPDNDEQDDKPAEKPAIEPPVSLNAEEKAAFAQLPEEAQRMLQAVETRRNGQVQEATTRAAEAQRSAKSDAARQTAEAQQHFAQQAKMVLDAYQPRQPNPADYGQDMQAFQQADAQWRYAAGQHQQLAQQVGALGAQASQALEQHQREAAQAEAKALRQALPDWFDDTKGPEIKSKLTAVGAELGYGDDLMAQAGSTDILALQKALVWKEKAEKWDAAQNRKMEGVRAAKTATPGTAQPRGSAQRQRTSEATSRLAKSGSLDDAASALSGLLNTR